MEGELEADVNDEQVDVRTRCSALTARHGGKSSWRLKARFIVLARTKAAKIRLSADSDWTGASAKARVP